MDDCSYSSVMCVATRATRQFREKLLWPPPDSETWRSQGSEATWGQGGPQNRNSRQKRESGQAGGQGIGSRDRLGDRESGVGTGGHQIGWS